MTRKELLKVLENMTADPDIKLEIYASGNTYYAPLSELVVTFGPTIILKGTSEPDYDDRDLY